MEKMMRLSIVTPDGKAAETGCDSIRFNVPDGAENKNAGGSVGIRRGHMDSMMTVDAGVVVALSGGEKVLQCRVEAGLAVISDNTVTILTDKAEIL